jgi:hypothetical protein
MDAVEAVLKEVPCKKRGLCGWLDFNYECLALAMSERNDAARTHAKTKTVEAKEMLRAARYILKKKKGVAKNKWFIHQLREGNGSTLPGGQDRKDPRAIWTMARKL